MDKNTEKAVWGIHGTDDSIFLKENKIVLGWSEFGDLNKVEDSREAFKEHYQKSYPKGKKERLELAPECCTDLFTKSK